MPKPGLDELYSQIAQLIRARREDAGLTQEELARRIGVTRGSVTNLEQARQRVQLDRLFEIAEALGVPLSALLPAEAEGGERLDITGEWLRGLPAAVRDWVQEMMVAPPAGTGSGGAGLEKLEALRRQFADIGLEVGMAHWGAEARQLGGVAGLPVPVERVAQGLGVHVKYGPTDADVGVTIYNAKTVILVAVNSLQALPRQRFAVAHALGHLVLHNMPFHVDLGFPETPGPEEEANAFAAELLVPEGELLKDLGGRRPDAEDDEAIRALAERYKVSTRLMAARVSAVSKI